MNGEGSQSDRHGAVEIDDNVIRLTDWLGPREELVPFGPGADAEEARSASGDAGQVPTADDFWSESSAALQDALTAPHPEPREHRTASPSLRRSRASAAALWGRRRASFQAQRRPAANCESSRRWVPAGVWGTATVAVLLAVAVILSSAGGGPMTRGVRVSAATAGLTDATTHGRSVTRASLALSGVRRTHPAPGRRARQMAARHHVRHDGGSRHHALRIVPAAQPVGYTTPAPSTPRSTGAASSSASSSPTSPSTASAPATTSAGAGSSSTPQPALGARGSLAPGSSPDG